MLLNLRTIRYTYNKGSLLHCIATTTTISHILATIQKSLNGIIFLHISNEMFIAQRLDILTHSKFVKFLSASMFVSLGPESC